jgi:hypothetical protein
MFCMVVEETKLEMISSSDKSAKINLACPSTLLVLSNAYI